MQGAWEIVARRSPLGYTPEDQPGLGRVSPGWATHVTGHPLGSLLCTRQLSLPLTWTKALRQARGVNSTIIPPPGPHSSSLRSESL